MPDANKENTLNQLVIWLDHIVALTYLSPNSTDCWSSLQVGAAFGAAGQRCMALSTALFVGESANWIPDLVERAKKLKVNAGML